MRKLSHIRHLSRYA